MALAVFWGNKRYDGSFSAQQQDAVLHLLHAGLKPPIYL